MSWYVQELVSKGIFDALQAVTLHPNGSLIKRFSIFDFTYKLYYNLTVLN